MTVLNPGLIFPESACRWPQVFHIQGIRLRPMTLFNRVFDRQTTIVKNRLKTQAHEGLGPQPKAGDSCRRSWLCRAASAPSQQACEPVMLSASSRSKLRGRITSQENGQILGSNRFL